MDDICKSTDTRVNKDPAEWPMRLPRERKQSAKCKTNGSIWTQVAIGFLWLVVMAIVFFVIHRLDVTTRQNSATLVRHEAKLAIHDSILGGFTPEFAAKLRKYFPNEQGR